MTGADATAGRLAHRPASASPAEPGPVGTRELPVDGGRPAVVHVPDVSGPLRLVVLLHGAGGDPRRTVPLLEPYAAAHRLLLLAPASRRPSWDVIHGGFGPDVRVVDALLDTVAATHEVSAYTVGGFSDGASYALTLGLANGDLFDSVLAFSPGFAAERVRHGSPRFFVSHGTADTVLPVDACSRRLVPALQRQGYAVTYEEFDGGHEVPLAVRAAALAWLSR